MKADPRDSDAALLANSGRRAQAEELTSVRRAPLDPLQELMGCPAPVWENQDSSKLEDGGCVIFSGSSRCPDKAAYAVWIGCQVGEHLDKSGVCAGHALYIRAREETVYHCRRCWDATGSISKARVIKIERINDDDAEAASGASPDLLP